MELQRVHEKGSLKQEGKDREPKRKVAEERTKRGSETLHTSHDVQFRFGER